jgi:hypothetical protein
MKLKEIWEAAKRDGLDMSYDQFRVYVSRLRRRQRQRKATQPQPPPASTGRPDDGSPPQPSDPFRNLREEREKAKQFGFEYDPFSINKKLI